MSPFEWLLGWSPLIVALYMVCSCQYVKWLRTRQTLTVALKMPPDTPTTIVLLALNPNDSTIFKFLVSKGKKQKDTKELTIRYAGKPIYNKKTKTFMFDNKEYAPTAIHVKSCCPQLE